VNDKQTVEPGAVVDGTGVQSSGDKAMASQFQSFAFPPASNPSGRSIMLSIRVSPELVAGIAMVLEQGKLPYESTSEFVRAAIQKLLIEEATATDDPNLPPLLILLKEWNHQVFQFKVREQLLEVITKLAKELEFYLDGGHPQRAYDRLEEVCTDLLQLKDSDSFWKAQCLMELFKYEVVHRCLENPQLGEQTKMAFREWKELGV